MPDLWPHQSYAIDAVLSAMDAGEQRLCVTTPTGGGKSMDMAVLAEAMAEMNKNCTLYTNRKLLVEQTVKVLEAHGLPHGVRSADYGADLGERVQVASIQTEESRSFKSKRWKLHDSDLVLIDEAHSQKGPVARKIIDAHVEAGATVCGFTATPLDIGDIYTKLIVAGTPSELRKCGALVPCHHYGPDEPDLSKIGKVTVGQDLTEKQNVKAIMREGIFGRVWEWWKKLNPDGKPTILFAPGVRESVFFAEYFQAHGVDAAHIDGDEIWMGKTWFRSEKGMREELLTRVRDGRVKVVCNRFVLREGLDLPEVEHMIFACVFGSVASYLQAGGRGLRACPSIGKKLVVAQDHGGNWHRHGSLNADRQWDLSYSGHVFTALRHERLRNRKCKQCQARLKDSPVCPCCNYTNEIEPMRCPDCGMVLAYFRCPCGFEQPVNGKRSRPVVMADGTLKVHTGDIFTPRRITTKKDGKKIWERMYFRARNGGMNFRQALGLFAVENYGWPSLEWPLMPVEDIDFFRLVADVPRERLR